MTIKYVNILQSKALQNLPKLVFLVSKQSIWQPWASCRALLTIAAWRQDALNDYSLRCAVFSIESDVATCVFAAVQTSAAELRRDSTNVATCVLQLFKQVRQHCDVTRKTLPRAFLQLFKQVRQRCDASRKTVLRFFVDIQIADRQNVDVQIVSTKM
jgi:hypothetical protein